MDFPVFTGDNSLGWIRQSEKFFDLARIPYEEWVDLAVMYMVDRAYGWLRGSRLPIEQFD